MIKKTFFTSCLIIFLCIYSNFILAKDYELLDKIVVTVEKDVITQKEIDKEILKKINFASPYIELPKKLTVKQNLIVFGKLLVTILLTTILILKL